MRDGTQPKAMRYTNEELFAVIAMLGRQFLDGQALLQETIALQHSMAKFIEAKLPNMTSEEQEGCLRIHARAESTLDQLQAATKNFREQWEGFIKRGEAD